MRATSVLIALIAAASVLAEVVPASAENPTTAAPPPPASTSNASKAHSLVQAAIAMTNGDQAAKLLWQATDLDPTSEEAYTYLGLYYQSKQDWPNLVKVYQKLIKYEPNQPNAYLNLGEAYISFTPPRTEDALVYFRKAYDLNPKNSLAALRLGEMLAQNGNRDDAIKYLRQALADTKQPSVSGAAENDLKQMGAL